MPEFPFSSHALNTRKLPTLSVHMFIEKKGTCDTLTCGRSFFCLYRLIMLFIHRNNFDKDEEKGKKKYKDEFNKCLTSCFYRLFHSSIDIDSYSTIIHFNGTFLLANKQKKIIKIYKRNSLQLLKSSFEEARILIVFDHHY